MPKPETDNPIHDQAKADVEGYISRTDTFTPAERKNTFRNDTFGPGAGPDRSNTFDPSATTRQSTTFGALTRTLTEIGQAFDPDGEFTKAVIEDYVEHGNPAQPGELPLPAGFARKAKFWKTVFIGGILAVLIGSLAALFSNTTDNMPEKWATCSYDDDSDCGDYYTGEKWWIAVSGLTGLGVGIFRWATNYPHDLAGLFQEINEMHVDWRWTPHTFLISMASLCGGATLGPEQALGNMSGGLATFVLEHIPYRQWWFEEKDYEGLLVLGAMSSALGALLNTPILGASMLHELGDPPRTFMESFIYFGIVATIAFAMYYCWSTNTWIDHRNDKSIFLTIEWLEDGGYQNWMVVTAFLIGCVSAAICFLCTFTLGICRQLFNRIRERVAFSKFLVEVVPPVIGGVVIGCVNWALPATVGNGSMVMNFIIKFGQDGSFTKSQLLATGFARIFLFGVSTQCGFIGGMIYPLVTIASIAGTLCYQYIDYLDPSFCALCFMVAVPMGVVPMPITFPLLMTLSYFCGFYQTVPLFVAGITSYTILCGSGFLKKLAMSADEAKRRDERAKEEKLKEAAAENASEKQAGGGDDDASVLSAIKESESSMQSGSTAASAASKSTKKKGPTIEQVSEKKMQAKKEADEFAINAYLPNKQRLASAEDARDSLA